MKAASKKSWLWSLLLICTVLVTGNMLSSQPSIMAEAFITDSQGSLRRSSRLMIFYRHQLPSTQSENKHTVSSATTASASPPILPGDMDNHRVNHMLQKHGWTLALASMAASALSTSHIWSTSSSPSMTAAATTSYLDTEALTVMTGMVTLVMIGLDYYVDVVSHDRDATLVHLSRVHHVATLFGRRPTLLAQESHRHNNMAGRIQPVLVTSSWLALVAATCDHVLYRCLLLPYLCLHMPVVVAIGVQAVVYGLVTSSFQTDTTSNNGLCSDEQRLVMWAQSIQACLLGSLSVLSGFSAFFLPIVAQTVYQIHVWNASWHSCNDQLDWMDEQERQQLRSSMDQVDETNEQPVVQATSATQSATRFFYAFDTDRKHSLSLCNARRAVTYAFLSDTDDETNRPAPEQVDQVFYQLADADTKRLRFEHFVPMLVTLKTNAMSSR